jgi:hypothetical protein
MLTTALPATGTRPSFPTTRPMNPYPLPATPPLFALAKRP